MFTVFLIKQAKKELADLPAQLRGATFQLIEALAQYGNELREPAVKTLGNGLKELRATSKDGISRSFFFFTKGKQAYIVHVMQKKTQKTPKQTLELAYSRMAKLQKELKNEK
ncbi:type II toxin-antitoxin system RelE/ParE family toxin [Testudinibacter sp. P27/CKL/0425]